MIAAQITTLSSSSHSRPIMLLSDRPATKRKRPRRQFQRYSPAASLAVSVGSACFGHAKASMTLDVYADLFGEDLDTVVDGQYAAIQSTADALRTGSAQ